MALATRFVMRSRSGSVLDSGSSSGVIKVADELLNACGFSRFSASFCIRDGLPAEESFSKRPVLVWRILTGLDSEAWRTQGTEVHCEIPDWNRHDFGIVAALLATNSSVGRSVYSRGIAKASQPNIEIPRWGFVRGFRRRPPPGGHERCFHYGTSLMKATL